MRLLAPFPTFFTDCPFFLCALAEQFAKLIQHWSPSSADIEILDPADWDRQGQYGELVDAVGEASKGNDVRVYKVGRDGTRAEYWVVTSCEGKIGSRLRWSRPRLSSTTSAWSSPRHPTSTTSRSLAFSSEPSTGLPGHCRMFSGIFRRATPHSEVTAPAGISKPRGAAPLRGRLVRAGGRRHRERLPCPASSCAGKGHPLLVR